MEGKIRKFFDIVAKHDKMSHAFLLCDVRYEDISDELINIISEYFFDNQTTSEEYPDLFVIKPDNGVIKKEQIIDLKEKFKTFSQISKNKVYIITEAYALNAYAANTLLKFLEEPESNIYAFLVSQNIDRVLSTIKSRCQIIICDTNKNDKLKKIDSETMDKSVELVKLFEKKGINCFPYIYELLGKKVEKQTIKNIIYVLKYLYKDVLNYKLVNDVELFHDNNDLLEMISNKNSEKMIINKLITINKLENMLEYNLNTGLFIDKLIIDLEMINHE